MVILDTTIIIDHLRLQGSQKSFLRKLEEKYSKDLLAVSILTIQELYSRQSTKDQKKKSTSSQLLDRSKSYPIHTRYLSLQEKSSETQTIWLLSLMPQLEQQQL